MRACPTCGVEHKVAGGAATKHEAKCTGKAAAVTDVIETPVAVEAPKAVKATTQPMRACPKCGVEHKVAGGAATKHEAKCTGKAAAVTDVVEAPVAAETPVEAPKADTKKDKPKRRAPEEHAGKKNPKGPLPAGTKGVGVDGDDFVVAVDKAGRHYWRPAAWK